MGQLRPGLGCPPAQDCQGLPATLAGLSLPRSHGRKLALWTLLSPSLLTVRWTRGADLWGTVGSHLQWCSVWVQVACAAGS